MITRQGGECKLKIKKYVALLGMLLMLVGISVGAGTTAEASIVKVFSDGEGDGWYMDTDSIRVYPGNSRYEVLISDYPDFSDPNWIIFVKSPIHPELYVYNNKYAVAEFNSGFYARRDGIKDISEVPDKAVLEYGGDPNYWAYPAGQNTTYDSESLDNRFFGKRPRAGNVNIWFSAVLGAVIASHNGLNVRTRTVTDYWNNDGIRVLVLK